MNHLTSLSDYTYMYMYTGNSGVPHTRELPTQVLGPSEFTHTVGPSGLVHLDGPSQFPVSLSKNICTRHSILVDI
jgi:hypothetical protein